MHRRLEEEEAVEEDEKKDEVDVEEEGEWADPGARRAVLRSRPPSGRPPPAGRCRSSSPSAPRPQLSGRLELQTQTGSGQRTCQVNRASNRNAMQ